MLHRWQDPICGSFARLAVVPLKVPSHVCDNGTAGAGSPPGKCRARDKNTNAIVALKKIKLPPTFNTEGFPMTSVREINILLALKHPNIVDVTEVVANKKDVYMVMEYVQQDLKHFLEKYKTKLKIGEVLKLPARVYRSCFR